MGYKKSVFRSLAMVTQLGLSIMTPVFLCVFIGYQIDSRWGTKWMVPLLILGVLAGGRCAWQLVSRIMAAERRESEALRESRRTQERTGISKPKQPSRVLQAGRAAGEEDDGDGMAEQADETADHGNVRRDHSL